MKKAKKIITSIFLVAVALVSLFLVFIGMINFSACFCPSNPIDLAEINSSAIDLENMTIISISEDDFKKYPELGVLFHNVTPIGDENLGECETKFVNSITVSEKIASEIRNEYSGPLYWKEGYYLIFVQQP